MKLSILIVNWNTRDLVIKCIHSILKYQPDFDYEIIVTDNYSQDGSVETLTNLFGPNKRIHIIQSLRNLGFAKGNNLAYENSSGQYILLLNPDTEVLESSLQSMADYMDQHPEVGVLGPKLLNPDGTLQRSVRRFPGIWSTLLVFSGLYRLIQPRYYLMDNFSYQESADVDQVMGAAFLTRRTLIEKLGLFDEKFWLWYEEVDFCKRVIEAGYLVRFYPEAAVIHHAAQSFSQLDVFARKRIVAKSIIHYFQKNGNWFDIMLVSISIPVVFFAAWLLDRFQHIFHFKLKPYV